MKTHSEKKNSQSAPGNGQGVRLCDDPEMIPTFRVLAPGERVEFPELGVRGVFLSGAGVKVAQFPDGTLKAVVPPGDVLDRMKTYIFADLVICESLSLNARELRFLRKRIGMTQEEIAKRLGQTREHYNRFENGRSPVSRELTLAVQRLCTGPMIAALNALPEDIRKANRAIIERIQQMITKTRPDKFVESGPIEVGMECDCLPSI